ncbi:MAG TPA: ABC transporter permease [Steroidobacteraceae bacterium]|nr:ABC transporter permease [Steroidobacteraceae bacterium]
MNPVRIILRREFASYFATPLAYVFIVIFLVLAGVCAFSIGQLFERGQADLSPLFRFLPWLYLFLVPAVSMRLWAEERKSGSIELLLTLPVTLRQAVVGKFLAAWIFVGIALALTFPMWITINYLGSPDNGAVFAAYLGAFLMAGAYLAVGSCMSALTNNQVIAFVLTAIVCFGFVLAGFPAVTDWSRAFFDGISGYAFLGESGKGVVQAIGATITDGIAGLSFLTHFDNISKGVLALRDLLFFALVITFFLLSSAALLEARKQ